MLASQLAIFSVSLPSGLVSLMFGYFSRVGSCHTERLLPPSSRVSITTSAPRPSQLLNSPRSWSSSFTTYRTLTAVSMSASIRSPSSPRVGPQPAALAVEQHLGTDPPHQRGEQLLRQRLDVFGGTGHCGRCSSAT